ncbi:hypothetical protein [Haloferula sp.]|uniref:hypothetical protein n=1 Tax=Haloferula sp. TaxID=2497595 RepID=UPI003C75469B
MVYYGLEYGFFHEMRELGVSSVMRIRNEPCMEIVEELDLTDADLVAGVNPLFPALWSGPTAGSGAARQKQFPSSLSDLDQ